MRRSPPGSAASTATGSRPCSRVTAEGHASAMASTSSSAFWPQWGEPPPGTQRRGPPLCYGMDEQQRILAEMARAPQREQDGAATWSVSLLQKALRQAPDGLPRVSTYTIWRTLHAAGLSWQKSRTWCETGVAMRKRKHGVVRVSDPDAAAKKS